MSSTAPINPILLDPDGDLIINMSLDEQRIALRVSSKLLRLASSVFNAMLAPQSPFVEGKALVSPTTSPAEINLFDDNYTGLVLAFNVVHHRVGMIPRKVSTEELFNVAIICDKYDMAPPMFPWILVWMQEFGDVAKESGDEKWLTISWVFQLQKTFQHITRDLILHARLDEKVVDLLRTRSGQAIGAAVPDRVLKVLIHTRKSLILEVIALAEEEISQYLSASRQSSNICSLLPLLRAGKVQRRSHCDCLALGSLLRFLSSSSAAVRKFHVHSMDESMDELEVVYNRDAKKCSVSDISEKYNEVEWFGSNIVESISSRGNAPYTHAECGPKKRILERCSEIAQELKGLELREFLQKDVKNLLVIDF